ncbi:MAG: XRE family transcriptional regulator [Anaerococcus sp.]|uniref:helix-turn-helix domain-containing protein n=1 Tax=Anaerococcus sp. TaxID=1872515 RepID=UPI0029013616|nr:helix-turn-helix domain-containing protein [Anaerococcus sp.]MDU2565511.1 XRE family transcriptional regulator [Anaerococcus sp.]
MNLNSSNIKLLMAEQELNIGLLAERMDMSRQWVSSNLQRGYSNTKFINKLAEALEVEIKDIVKLED